MPHALVSQSPSREAVLLHLAIPGWTGDPALDVFIVLAIIGAGLGGLAAIYRYTKRVVQWIVRGVRRVDDFLKQWPRVEGRLEALEELRPNGGTSMFDKLDRVEVKLDQHTSISERRLDAYRVHLAQHGIDLPRDEDL